MTLTCETPRPEFAHPVSHLVAGLQDSREQTLDFIIFRENRPSVQNCTHICSQLLISYWKSVRHEPPQAVMERPFVDKLTAGGMSNIEHGREQN